MAQSMNQRLWEVADPSNCRHQPSGGQAQAIRGGQGLSVEGHGAAWHWGVPFLRTVPALLSHTSARTCVRGAMSRAVGFSAGVRQGARWPPRSPYLLARRYAASCVALWLAFPCRGLASIFPMWCRFRFCHCNGGSFSHKYTGKMQAKRQGMPSSCIIDLPKDVLAAASTWDPQITCRLKVRHRGQLR